MSKYRRAAKRDANEREIIESLQELGAYVIQESNIDLYVIWKGECYPMEVKMPKGRLTPYQIGLHDKLMWEHEYIVPIVQTVDDALRVIGAIHDKDN